MDDGRSIGVWYPAVVDELLVVASLDPDEHGTGMLASELGNLARGHEVRAKTNPLFGYWSED